MGKVRKYLITIIISLLVTLLTLIGQKYLSVNLNFLVNSASMWLIPAFLIPYFMKEDKKNSVLLSIISLLCCVLGYYIFESILNNHSFEIGGMVIFWIVCAFVGGIVFGLGSNFSNTKENIIKNISMNLLPAVFISEGFFKIIHINDYNHMILGVILQIVIGIVLYLFINRKQILKKESLLSILLLVVLGTVAFSILFV